ncbi:ChaC-like protein [Hyaloraphidium curvatum]|nr:ChaC-like protein [Hyaloraphidium curvatum]
MLLGRGTPDRPGLMLAVEPGGRCEAVAHRIAPEHVEEETSVVWLREMISGFYVAEWVDCVGEDGGALPCVAFVADPEHPRIIPRDTYPMAKKAETIAKAVGRSGANRDYLYRVRAELVRLGIRDDYIEELFERVTAITGESGDPLPFGGNVQ